MAEQVRRTYTKRQKEAEQEKADGIPHPAHKTRQELGTELDGLLDEIDEVLEENAEEFVRTYIQKGGQ